MKIDRRKFLSLSGSAVAYAGLSEVLNSCNKKGDFGIQLWSVKDQMAQDPRGTLKALAQMGYTQIESFGGEKGIFWGMQPKEYAAYCSDLGLKTIASHCDPEFSIVPAKWSDFQKLAQEAKEAGLSYLINPFVGMLKTKEDYYKVSETFNKQGEYCKSLGLKYGYHNHHYSFKDLEGELPQDIMIKNTQADLVCFEMDIYWVVEAGQDPVKNLEKYPGRYELFHVKDYLKPAIKAEVAKTHKADPFFGLDASCVLGTGTIDVAAVLKRGHELGVKYDMVEQEFFYQSEPMADVAKDAKYMASLK
jgi:sugar phosphate isomerase/epimerase